VVGEGVGSKEVGQRGGKNNVSESVGSAYQKVLEADTTQTTKSLGKRKGRVKDRPVEFECFKQEIKLSEFQRESDDGLRNGWKCIGGEGE